MHFKQLPILLYALFASTAGVAQTCNLTNIPVAPDTTICLPGNVTLTGTSSSGSIWWSDINDFQLNLGLQTTVLNVTGNTTVRAREFQATTNSATLGAVAGTLAGGYGNFTNGQYITILDTVRIDSIRVDANGPVTAAVQFFDFSNNPTGINIPGDYDFVARGEIFTAGNGITKVPVNVVLLPGAYFMNISFLGGTGQLFRTTSGAVFPYTATGLMTIDSVNFAGARFYYTFDVQVSQACLGPLKNVNIVFQETYAGRNRSIQICNSSSGYDLTPLITGSSGGTYSSSTSGAISGAIFNPNNLSLGNHEVKYIVTGAGNCPNDTAVYDIEIIDCGCPVSPPMLGSEIVCPSGTAINLWSDNPRTSWFNSNGDMIGTGDTINQVVSGATTFTAFATDIKEVSLYVGPEATLSASGFGNFTNGQYITALDSIMILSFDVETDDSASAVLQILNVAQTDTLYVSDRFSVGSAGFHTVKVDLLIPPGAYYMQLAQYSGGQFHRSTEGAIYPYIAPGLLVIDSVEFTTQDRYYYTYNMQVANACKSSITSIMPPVTTAPNAGNLSVTMDTICAEDPGNQQFDLSSIHSGGDFLGYWVDVDNSGVMTGTVLDFSNQALWMNTYRYRFMVDQRGSCDADSVEVSLHVTDCTLSIDQFEKIGWSVYPNPTSGNIHIEYPEDVNEISSVQIINNQGQIVFFADHTVPKPNVLDLSHLPVGLYHMKVIADGQSMNRKLILTK